MNRASRGYLLLLFLFVAVAIQAQTPSRTVVLQAGSAVVQPGETVCVDITGSGLKHLIGMQLSVRWDSTLLDFIEVKNLDLPTQSQNDFGFLFTKQGAVTFLYIVPPGTVLPEKGRLFTLCLRAKNAPGKSSVIEVSDRPTAIEFVGDIANSEDLVSNFATVSGSVQIAAPGSTPQPLVLNVAEGLTNCITGGSTAIQANAAGGQVPYVYAWKGPNGFIASTPGITAQRRGSYELSVTDALGQAVRARFEVDSSAMRLGNATLTPAGCTAGGGGGAITLAVAGGKAPYAYSWSNNSTTASQTNLGAGTYGVTVTDQYGCQVKGNYEITSGSGVTLAPAATPPVCGASNGSIRLNATSASGGLVYSWSNGTGGDERSGLAPGVYAVTVTDSKGCRAERSFDFSWQPVTVVLSADCGAGNDNAVFYSARAIAGGGKGPYIFQWSTGIEQAQQQESKINLAGAGAYAVTVTDAGGCKKETSATIAVCGSENPVWPGDANADGRVNQFDLLHIGLGFGRQGAKREQASSAWKAQPSVAWNEATPVSRINYKYADSDGNGRIEAADTSAILQNWGRTVSGVQQQPVAVSPRGAGVALFIEPASAMPGEQAAFNIILGEKPNEASNAYGLVFTVVYDSLAVKASDTKVSFDNSWLGTPGSGLLTIQHNDAAAHRIHIALTRSDGQNRSGSGAIGRLLLRINQELPNQATSYALPFRIENARLISISEQSLELAPLATQATAGSTTGTDNPELAARVRLYPNPAQDAVRIELPQSRVEQVELLHFNGHRIMMWQEKTELNLPASLANGMYWVRIRTAEGVVSKRLMVVR